MTDRDKLVAKLFRESLMRHMEEERHFVEEICKRIQAKSPNLTVARPGEPIRYTIDYGSGK